MSDTSDDVRRHIAWTKHERGECDPTFCIYCEEEEDDEDYDFNADDLAFDAERERERDR